MGIWHVLTKERPLSGSTTAMWAAGALGALSIAIAAQNAQSPSSSHVQPVAIEPVSLPAASLPAASLPVSLPAVSLPDPVADIPALVAPDRHSATTTIQTLMPDPELRQASPASVAPRARRARRLSEATSMPKPGESSPTPRDEPALTIRLER
jgi:hypothetical protein